MFLNDNLIRHIFDVKFKFEMMPFNLYRGSVGYKTNIMPISPLAGPRGERKAPPPNESYYNGSSFSGYFDRISLNHGAPFRPWVFYIVLPSIKQNEPLVQQNEPPVRQTKQRKHITRPRKTQRHKRVVQSQHCNYIKQQQRSQQKRQCQHSYDARASSRRTNWKR